jgi:hypothetical protein
VNDTYDFLLARIFTEKRACLGPLRKDTPVRAEGDLIGIDLYQDGFSAVYIVQRIGVFPHLAFDAMNLVHITAAFPTLLAEKGHANRRSDDLE